MKRWIGFVRLRIRGLDIERQIKKILSLGIVMGNCKRESPTQFSFDVLPWEVKRIRRSGIDARLGARGGLTVLLYSLRKRIGLYVGLTVMLAVMIFLQGRVFVFEVSGNSRLSDEEILGMINAKEIIGRTVNGELLEDMERQMVGGEINWASVSRQGIKLTVTVKEKPELPDADYLKAGDIVASKVGLITELTVLQGVAAVEEGKLVMPGEVIISGQLMYAGQPADYVAAMGKCEAKVWYSVEEEVSLEREVLEDTGRSFTSSGIMMLEREIGMEQPDFERYRVSEKKIPIASIGIPIFTVERVYYEQSVRYEPISAEQALQERKQELEQRIRSMLPVEAQEISFYIHETENGAIIGVSAVTSEDIGVFSACSD